MRRFFLFIIICCLTLAMLAGCNSAEESLTSPNELMSNVSAERGAFTFYSFDGETTLSRTIFQDPEFRQGIIDELLSAPAARVTGWTLDDITLPIFAIRMGTTCGHGMQAAWSNGFWITQTRDVYRFDFDFEEFIERQPWEIHRNTNFAWFPNAMTLTQDINGWRKTFLTPAAELNPPAGIEMALVSNTDESVTFTLTNNNIIYWIYGLHFRVDALLNGVWYYIPTTPTAMWWVNDIGFFLEAGQTETKTHRFTMYGELPPGTYRLVVHDMYVVFEIN